MPPGTGSIVREVVEIYSAHVAFAAVVGVHRSVVTCGQPGGQ